MFGIDDYRAIIAPHCGPHFSFGEICRRTSPRHRVPPFALARNIIPTLEAANELRIRLAYRCDLEGWPFHGLRVNAAYRPQGGSPNSQHKKNRALDLDLAFVDWDPATVRHSKAIRTAWYEVAVAFWEELEIAALGLYCSRGMQHGVRVHIDCRPGRATWQHAGSTAIHPPCAYAIAERLDLR